jgi:hypothetical protein
VHLVHHSFAISRENSSDWCTRCTILKVSATETRHIGASGAPFFRHSTRKQFRLVHVVHHFEGLCHGNAAHWCIGCTILKVPATESRPNGASGTPLWRFLRPRYAKLAHMMHQSPDLHHQKSGHRHTQHAARYTSFTCQSPDTQGGGRRNVGPQASP